MAAVTAAVAAVVVAGYSAGSQSDAALAAGAVNAQNSEFNADMAVKQAAEDEKRFRVAARKQNAMNRTAVAGAGIELTGSALDVLEENSRTMEEDAINIKMGGKYNAQAYQRQADMSRVSGRSAATAANMQGAAEVLKGSSNAYNTGKTQGTW